MKLGTKFKRIVSMLLVVCMVAGVLSVGAFAADEAEITAPVVAAEVMEEAAPEAETPAAEAEAPEETEEPEAPAAEEAEEEVVEETAEEEAEPVETQPGENKTFTLTVGGTATDTINGVNAEGDTYTIDTTVATAAVEGGTTEGTPAVPESVKKESTITNGSSYIIGDGTRWIKLNGTTIGYTTDKAEATEWAVTTSYGSYYLKSGNYYLCPRVGLGDFKLNLSESSEYASWSYDQNGFYYDPIVYYRTRYLRWSGSAWQVDTSSSNRGVAYTYTPAQEAIPGTPYTTVTFTAVGAGTTTVTIGNVTYTINVAAEDISGATDASIELWITNRKITANGSNKVAVTATQAYGENGVAVMDIVPANGTMGSSNNEYVLWKVTALDKRSHEQTTGAGDNETMNGTDFNYIRYYNKTWSYSVDGKTWTNVTSNTQLVAYYLQRTNVTNEITTDVVDYGEVPHTGYDSSNFVIVDYSVKYESGEEAPASFSVSGKTMAFHCDSNDSNTVHRKDRNSVYYRDIAMIRGVETGDYEIYMITVTSTSDSSTSYIANNCKNATNYSYAGTEYVAWAATQTDLDNSGLKQYSSISGKYKCVIGGEPAVNALEIYNRHGMKVTYYVRAKVTEDALTVNYVNQTTGENFYNYNIAVVKDTTFDDGIALADPDWKANLVNGSVENSLGNTQTVSADLATMPAIGVSYRYSDYTCTRVERSADGKTVTLYYTFKDEHKFVADFGLPLNITAEKLGISGDWTSATVTGVTYGTATASVGEGVTYTPTQTLKGVEQMSLHLSNGSQTSTQIIYIYPATTVYYEEGFATYTGSWTDKDSKGSGTQAAQKLGESNDEYGTDAKYAAEVAGPSNRTQAAATSSGETATFSFTGTGVGVYANTTADTGLLFIRIKQGDKTLRSYLVDTAMQNGDTDLTDFQSVTAYNVPVVVVTDLEYGSYDVVISHPQAARTKDDGTREFRTEPVYLDGFRVYGTIADSTIFAGDDEDKPDFREMRDTVLTNLKIKEGDIINDESGAQVYTPSGEAIGEGTMIDSALIVGTADDILSDDTNSGDLVNAGPKNEIYLKPNTGISFAMKTEREVQIGLKALNEAVTVSINGTEKSITSSTDMFYTVIKKGEAGSGKTVSITNKSGGILAVTLLKVCDDPYAAITAPENIAQTLIDLGLMEAPEVEEPVDENPFEDVAEGKYYYDPVLWAVKSGITNGKDATHFAPNDSCTRAQAVTFLWRAKGQPEPKATTCDFVDVKPGSYYYKAVLWAVENGITNGIDATHFAPNAECTRAQIVTFMYRAAGKPTGFFSTECGFEDVKAGSFYETAVAWAVACGVTKGTDAAHFAPAENCTRGQIVTFLWRAGGKG